MATSHANILFCLSVKKVMSLGELSEKINRDKSTTTILVRKLEQENYVKTQKAPSDSRKKTVSLTAEGEKFTRTTEELSKKLLEKSWQGFSDEEKETLTGLLNRLSDNLK